MVGLNGKVVIVTGASSGIGASLAREFSRAGASVALAARRADRLRETARSCPHETLLVPADLLRPRDRETLVRETQTRFGRIDILVNNAGMGMYGSFLQTPETAWRQVFDTNLFSMVFLTQAVLPVMQAQGGGLILNLASIGGLIAHARKVTAYVASKHAVIGFSRGLARDLAGTGIRVLAACPHLTDTEFFGGSAEDLMRARELNPIPILRKDFIIDEYQVIEAKAMGADAILLIAAALDKRQLKKLARFSHSLNLQVLMEVHNARELGHLNEFVDMVGVNNRDLKTFTVDTEISVQLAPEIPADFIKISESGITSPLTIKKLKGCGYQGFLIGGNFMGSPEPAAAFSGFVKLLIFGND
jgi:short-subunit dehydrogenase